MQCLSGQDQYYTNLAREDYFTRLSAEPAGSWLGTGSAKLGLHGKVDKDALHALFEGFSPEGVPLVKNAGKNMGKRPRKPGWDLTFSVPKSVSVLWACASPAERKIIEKCVRRAVEKVIAHMEAECAFSRIGRGGAERTPAKLLVAAFVHDTSRALDPQYHVHALCLNLGWCDDSKTRALVSKPFYDNKMLLGSLFRCHLAHYLDHELGLRTERPLDRNGRPRSWFEVMGVPERLCKEFSKRRQAIEKELGSLGLETAAAAAQVTLRTRERKSDIPPRAELFAQWQDVGRKFRFTQETIAGLLGRTKTRDQAAEYRKALKEAVEQLTYQDSHFNERQLLTEVLNASQGRGLDPQFVLKETRRQLNRDHRFVKLGPKNGQMCYTTREVMAVEKELLQTVKSLHEQQFKPLTDRIVKHVIEKKWSPATQPKKTLAGKAIEALSNRGKHFTLNPEQAEAVRYLTQTPGRLKLVSGLAGTGKTTMLRAAREAFEKQGYTVRGCATAGVAAKRLFEGSGIQSDTVRMRLLELFPKPWQLAKHHINQLIRAARKRPTCQYKTIIDPKTVLVVDESGQVGTRDFTLIAKAVEQGGGILVCVGDERQLPSIEMGGVFGSMIQRFGGEHLNQITRQEDSAEREAVRKLSEGKGKEVIEEYARRGQLHVGQNRQKTREELISHWTAAGGAQNPADNLIFVGTNQEVDAYNDLAQDERSKAGKLNLSQMACVDGETLFGGDRVIFQKKSRRLNLENGDMGTVVAIRTTPLGTDVAVQLDGEKRPPHHPRRPRRRSCLSPHQKRLRLYYTQAPGFHRRPRFCSRRWSDEQHPVDLRARVATSQDAATLYRPE